MSHAELNAALARDEEELALFGRLDEAHGRDWPDAGLPTGGIEPWLAFTDARLAAVREHVANPFAAPGTVGASGAARVDGAIILPPHLAPSGPRAARPKAGTLSTGADGWVDDEPGGDQAKKKRGRSGSGKAKTPSPTPTAGGGGGPAPSGRTAGTRGTEDEEEEDEEEEDEGGPGLRPPAAAARRRLAGRSVDDSGTEEEHVDDEDNVVWDE